MHHQGQDIHDSETRATGIMHERNTRVSGVLQAGRNSSQINDKLPQV